VNTTCESDPDTRGWVIPGISRLRRACSLRLLSFAQPECQLHAKGHHARLDIIEPQIDENIAAAGDRSRVIETAIPFLGKV